MKWLESIASGLGSVVPSAIKEAKNGKISSKRTAMLIGGGAIVTVGIAMVQGAFEVVPGCDAVSAFQKGKVIAGLSLVVCGIAAAYLLKSQEK